MAVTTVNGATPGGPRRVSSTVLRSARSIYQVLLLAAVVFARLGDRQQRRREPAPAEHRLGLRLPGPHRRLRHLTDADRILQHLHLRPRLLGGPAQHAAGRGPRHRRRHRPRLRRRHRAPVLQLARRPARHGLRRGRAQRAAAAAAVLLVLRGAEESAGPAPEPRAAGRRLLQRARPLPARPGAASRASEQSPWRSSVGVVARIAISMLGAAPADGDGPALPGALGHRSA